MIENSGSDTRHEPATEAGSPPQTASETTQPRPSKLILLPYLVLLGFNIWHMVELSESRKRERALRQELDSTIAEIDRFAVDSRELHEKAIATIREMKALCGR